MEFRYERAEGSARAVPAARRSATRMREAGLSEQTARNGGHRSVPRLFRQLTEQTTTLFTKEMALARSEIRNAMQDARAGVAGVASGAAVLHAGGLVLLFAAVAGLALVMAMWLAALIVGAATLLIGFAMLSTGKRKLTPSAFTPERTVEQLRRDKHMVQHDIRNRGES